MSQKRAKAMLSYALTTELIDMVEEMDIYTFAEKLKTD